MRTLLNGSKVKEQKTVTDTIFATKCPDKWLHIDLEEGKIYVPKIKKTQDGIRKYTGSFKYPSADQLESGMMAIKERIIDLKNK